MAVPRKSSSPGLLQRSTRPHPTIIVNTKFGCATWMGHDGIYGGTLPIKGALL